MDWTNVHTFECSCSIITERCTGITVERHFVVFRVRRCLSIVSHLTIHTSVDVWHSRIFACHDPNECPPPAVCACEGVSDLEGVASANVLQFLGDLRRCSVQLLCHTFLLVRVHAVKLLAQITIDHILERKARGRRK